MWQLFFISMNSLSPHSPTPHANTVKVQLGKGLRCAVCKQQILSQNEIPPFLYLLVDCRVLVRMPCAWRGGAQRKGKQ